MARDHIEHRRHASAIRHMTDVDPGGGLQHFGAEMLRAAIAGRAIGQSRFRFGVGNELGQRFCRDRRIDDQRKGHAGDEADRRKILHGVIGQLLVERLVDGKRGRGRHQQRVAVGLRFGDLVRAQRRAGAGLVLDNHGGGKTVLELVGDQSAKQIGGSSGGVRHDHLDGPAGIGRLGPRRNAREPDQPTASRNHFPARQRHAVLPRVVFLICCEPP